MKHITALTTGSNGPEYKERSRVWKSTDSGKFYQKRVSWTKEESK